MSPQPRRRLLVLVGVLASFFVPVLASASTGFYADTRVGGFDLGDRYSLRAKHALALSTHQGYALGYDDLASGSDSLLAARGTRSLDDLSRAAGAADRNGLTRAGRALQKHGDRPGSAFPDVSGHGNLNATGQDIVDDILTTPGAAPNPNRFGGMDIIAPDGRGVRYDGDGGFMGFLEPPR